MKNVIARQIGTRVAHQAARNYIGEGKKIDAKLGVALFRDRRVPVAAKMAALALAFALMVVVNALELPIEALIAFLVPLLGMGMELLWNGAETIIGTLLFSSLLLPFIAPKELVARIRGELAGPIPVPVESTVR